MLVSAGLCLVKIWFFSIFAVAISWIGSYCIEQRDLHDPKKRAAGRVEEELRRREFDENWRRHREHLRLYVGGLGQDFWYHQLGEREKAQYN